jgi:hypothetical protein
MPNVTSVQNVSGPIHSPEQKLEEQLFEIVNLVRKGKTSRAMVMCANLLKKYENDAGSTQRIKEFMGKFALPISRQVSLRAEPAGDSAGHADFLQEIIYQQPLGSNSQTQASFQHFGANHYSVGGEIGYRQGGILDLVQYSASAELDYSSGDIETAILTPLPLFQIQGFARYSFTYTRGYFGYNLGTGVYGDSQVGASYNNFNFGMGYAAFPYFNSSKGEMENSRGFYGEIDKYFQVGDKVGMYGFFSIPFGPLDVGQLPFNVGSNFNLKLGKLFEINLQGSFLFTKGYVQGRGSVSGELSF